jgi:hypothetical protein
MNNIKLQCFTCCLRQKYLFTFILLFSVLALLAGCTSLDHEGSAQPQFEQHFSERPEVVSLEGSGKLVIALDLMLVSRGIKVLASPIQIVSETSSTKRVTRYAVTATSVNYDVCVTAPSVDHDECVPEDSPQMKYNISVTDLQKNELVFSMNGNYGFKDIIVKRFELWFFQ